MRMWMSWKILAGPAALLLLGAVLFSLHLDVSDPSAKSDPTRNLDTEKYNNVLVIGDSISLGQGALGASRYCDIALENSDPGSAYGALVAEALSADIEVHAWGGHGLVRNYNGFRSRTISDRVGDLISRNKIAPFDLALIHVGTNDFSGFDPGAAFEDSLRDLIFELHAHSPDAMVIALTGPMLSGVDLDKHIGAVSSSADRINRELDLPVAQHLHLPFSLLKNGQIGCSWHPSVKMHDAMADRILRQLHNGRR